MSGTRFLAALQRRRLRLQEARFSDRRPAKTPIISHAIFGFCGVLYDDSAWRRWLLCLLSRMGLQTHYAAFFRVWDREFQVDVWRGNREFWHALKEFLVTAGLSRGQADEVEAASRARFRAFEEDIRCFPGVTETLGRMASCSCELTVLKRGAHSPEILASRLGKLGLQDRIQRLECANLWPLECLSHEFQRLAGTHPQQVAFVGRDPHYLLAASQAGLLTIAFNHDADAQADIYIDHFDQLLEVIELGSGPMLAAG